MRANGRGRKREKASDVPESFSQNIILILAPAARCPKTKV